MIIANRLIRKQIPLTHSIAAHTSFIVATDREIDKLVYELFEKEIKIVEGE